MRKSRWGNFEHLFLPRWIPANCPNFAEAAGAKSDSPLLRDAPAQALQQFSKIHGRALTNPTRKQGIPSHTRRVSVPVFR
jgi:hypothetical protein